MNSGIITRANGAEAMAQQVPTLTQNRMPFYNYDASYPLFRLPAAPGACHGCMFICIRVAKRRDIKCSRDSFSTSLSQKIDRMEIEEHQRVDEEDGIQAKENGNLTLREVCADMVPSHVLQRAEELGFKLLTQAQCQSLPVTLAGKDCIIQSQTGTGKTLAYMLPILSKVSPSRAAVQAIVVVPSRELAIQVGKVARMLAGSSTLDEASDLQSKGQRSSIVVMTLLGGANTIRYKKWLKAAPPQVVVGTLYSICQMIETSNLKMHAVSIVVIDEIDLTVHTTHQGQLNKLLTAYSSPSKRQTIFASATIPQQHRFIHDCIQNKWTKGDLIHVCIKPTEKMPLNLQHRYKVCDPENKLEVLFSTVLADSPKAAFIFVNELSAKAKARFDSTTSILMEFFETNLASDATHSWKLLLLEEDLNINSRFSTYMELKGGRFILFATDLASRGLDVPEVTHIYNFDMPPSSVTYIHRAGRTARKPLEDDLCIVTTFVNSRELFLIRRFENELSCKFENI